MADGPEFGIDVGVYGNLATPETILGLAALAEEHAYQSIWLADHVVFPATIDSKYPYSRSGEFPVSTSAPLLEPIATMGVLVGATQRLRIGTAVLVMPYRNPVVLARMLATLDVLSGGRIVLGAGSGWLAEEFSALATAEFAERGRVTDEYLEIFKALCQGGEVAYEGAHYRLDPVYSNPGSVQRPHPPILIGGTSKAALRRVAKLGDGWLSVALRPEQLVERLGVLRQLCDDHDKRYDDLALCHKLFISIGQAKEAADGGREPGTGAIEDIIDDIRRVADLGYKSFILRYLGSDAAAQTSHFKTFAAEVMPKI